MVRSATHFACEASMAEVSHWAAHWAAYVLEQTKAGGRVGEWEGIKQMHVLAASNAGCMSRNVGAATMSFASCPMMNPSVGS